MKLQQRIEGIQKLQTIETPWAFKRIFGTVQIHGDNVAIYSTGDTDFVTVEEMRQALEWLVVELDGTIKWASQKGKKHET
jgi:hypothetical protein